MAKYLEEDGGGLIWGPLVEGTLVRRYMRFLADVKLRNNRTVKAHCPNTGSMLACSQPGQPVYLSKHDNPNRKLKYTWEIIDMPESRVGVNTGVPNRLTATAISHGLVEPLAGYTEVKREVKTSAHTRLDLGLTGQGLPPCYIEIKNCTLVEGDIAYFPDAVTERGRKHLHELARLVQGGARGIIFYLIQRMDAKVFQPAVHIDSEYGKALREVVSAGVEVLAYDVDISLERIDLRGPVPVKL
jgi:sugar fermentation stimulation protein A